MTSANRAMVARRYPHLFLAVALSAVAPGDSHAQLALETCSLPNGAGEGKCGTLTVFENRELGTGRTIGLNVVVVPALSDSPAPDPIFVLAGGPGQGAASLSFIFARYAERENRDLVLVDQRGTGRSNPLVCTSGGIAHDVAASLMARMVTPACADTLDADLRMYTTSIAMDDLEDVRVALGYDRINLYGGSYGTRAAMAYARRHPEHVRSMILSSTFPLTRFLPLGIGHAADQALFGLFDDCAADERCHTAFPDPKAQLARVLGRLDEQPEAVQGRVGSDTVELELTGDALARMVFSALYTVRTAARLPYMIDMADRGDFAPMVDFAISSELPLVQFVARGMQLSVVCAEDAPGYTAEAISEADESWLLRGTITREFVEKCRDWPRGPVPNGFWEPLVSDVPTLFISGEFDPATPPRFADEAARTLPNSWHIVLPKQAHSSRAGCAPRLISSFLDAASGDDLDTTCVQRLRRPPFQVN